MLCSTSHWFLFFLPCEMDPLQFLQECKGKTVEVVMNHGEVLYGVLVCGDDHGNIALQDVVSSLEENPEESSSLKDGAKRPRSEAETLRLIRGEFVKSISIA